MTATTPDTRYGGRDNLEAMKKATRYNNYLVNLVRRFAAGDRIVDHGAGAGTIARLVSAGGPKVLCMEPDDELRNELSASGFEVTATLADLQEASVDCVYTLNVLEHIRDDGEAIAGLHRCLKPGGRLLVYVPAFPVLYSQMDKHVGHFRRYRRAPLVKRLTSAGFTVHAARYLDSLGFVATLIYKLIGDSSGCVSPGSVAVYDTVVFPVSRIIDVLTIGSFGKNLMVVATKTPGRHSP